jgi:hypothetical protein
MYGVGGFMPLREAQQAVAGGVATSEADVGESLSKKAKLITRSPSALWAAEISSKLFQTVQCM